MLKNSKRIISILGIKKIDKNSYIRALVNVKEYLNSEPYTV